MPCPAEALEPFAEACRVLELVPWNGGSAKSENSDAPVTTLAFGMGRGMLACLILEDDQRVDLLDVFWLSTIV